MSAAMTLLASCQKSEVPYSEAKGTLSFSGLEIGYDTELETKGSIPSPGNYAIFVFDEAGEQVYKASYSKSQEDNGISLLAGNYTIEARSTEEAVPASVFEVPIYGVKQTFSIEAGQTTNIGALTCTLLQCKVTVDYDNAFLNEVTGDCQTDVTVTTGSPLTYKLSYNEGVISYDKSAGYFAINNGSNTTMTIVFKGKINGKSQKMTASLTGIQPKQWRQITFYKKSDQQGNATFQIGINSFVDDEELVVPLTAEYEAVSGEDPDAPKGDGGITLTFSQGCSYTDLNNIEVPNPDVEAMNLSFDVTVPNGIKKFVVDITSDNQSFMSSVALTGSTQLDLINPLASQSLIFDIVPFPHGQDLLGKTALTFNLNAAQEPIYIFKGSHTFTMTITDQKGCKNSIPVVLVVK